MHTKAFTLIELLVVVLIIGILAAVAVPQYQKAVLKSRFTQAKIMANALAQAEEVYYLANGEYTWNLNDLDISFDYTSAISEGISSKVCTEGTRSCHYLTSWGSCDLSKTRVFCRIKVNGQESLSYLSYFKQANTGEKGKTYCGTYKRNTDAPTYKICQAETGKQSPSFEGTYLYFLY